MSENYAQNLGSTLKVEEFFDMITNIILLN